MRYGRLFLVGAFLMIAMSSSAANGQEAIKAFFRSVARGTVRNHEWPKPFTAEPRISARAPFNIMVANGWRFQNMLGEHHFDPTTGELTEGGRYKISQILFETPIHHQAIYVHRANDPDAHAARMKAVNDYAVSINPEGRMPTIYETRDEPPLHSGERTYAIRQLANQVIPSPVLPGDTLEAN